MSESACTIRQRKNQQALSNQGATVGTRNSPVGGNLEQIQTPEGRSMPTTSWGKKVGGERDESKERESKS